MNFGILLVRDGERNIRRERVQSIDSKYFKFNNLDETRRVKNSWKKAHPNCEYQIVEYVSMEKLYGVKCTEGLDHSLIKERRWYDDFVLLSKENAYASIDLPYVQKMAAMMTETWESSGKYIYKIWDIDLDREVLECSPTPQSNKNFSKLVEWLRS